MEMRSTRGGDEEAIARGQSGDEEDILCRRGGGCVDEEEEMRR